jgi:hypothetical protein
VHTLFLARFAQKKMKRIIIEVEDLAYEPVVGMLELCNGVRIASVQESMDVMDDRDACMRYAITTLRRNKVFRRHYDYSWIMQAINDGVMDDYEEFESPQTFINYLCEIGIDELPDRSTISRACSNVYDSYPNWQFMDVTKPSEILRRKNVVKQFLSAFGEAKRASCIKNCTK